MNGITNGSVNGDLDESLYGSSDGSSGDWWVGSSMNGYTINGNGQRSSNRSPAGSTHDLANGNTNGSANGSVQDHRNGLSIDGDVVDG